MPTADSATLRALYIRGSDFETSDAVFGVKETLIVDLNRVNPAQAARFGVAAGSRLLEYHFVLATDAESRLLREVNAMEAMREQGLKMKLWRGLPVPDVD